MQKENSFKGFKHRWLERHQTRKKNYHKKEKSKHLKDMSQQMKPQNKHLINCNEYREKSIKQGGLKANKPTRKVNIWKNAMHKWKNATNIACDEVNI